MIATESQSDSQMTLGNVNWNPYWTNQLAAQTVSSKPKYDPANPNDPLYGSQENPDSGIFPTGFKILVELSIPADLVKAMGNGIEIPETVRTRYEQAAMVGKVVQVGAGCYRPDRYPEGPWCFPGQTIVMSPYNGTRVKSTINGKQYRLINEDTLDAVVVDAEAVERG